MRYKKRSVLNNMKQSEATGRPVIEWWVHACLTRPSRTTTGPHHHNQRRDGSPIRDSNIKCILINTITTKHEHFIVT